jgi:hypothetical protein
MVPANEEIRGSRVMRRLIGSLMFAAFVACCAAPLAAVPAGGDEADSTPQATPVAVQHVNVPATGLRDEAAMVLVGTMLIGLAAAVRRAV